MAEERDLIVIGSGPGGYVAAIRAGHLGMKVTVVEKDPKLGGTCLHRGCIPTKALLHAAEVLETARAAGKLGIEVSDPRLDLPKVQARKQKVVDKNARGIEYLFKKGGVEAVRGVGRLVGPREVEVERDGERQVLRGKHVLLATGSVPRDIPAAPFDGHRVLSSDHILELDRVPESLAVLGAGAVGAEFASIFASFGSRVTLVEMLPRILPLEDEEVSAELARVFKRRRIQILTEATVTAAEAGEEGVRLRVERGGEESLLQASLLLVAVGRRPVSERLGLEAAGVEVEKGYIRVNERMQSTVPHIYAIGDVVATPWLAHVASAEGILAVEHMAGQAVHPIDYDRVPSCTYCDPQVASVGLSEAEARQRGHDVQSGKFPFSASGKAAILDKLEGFVKVVRETRYDELLGVHIIGAQATELIAEACAALQVESTAEELARTMHAHPTLSEAVMEAAHASFGRAIHV